MLERRKASGMVDALDGLDELELEALAERVTDALGRERVRARERRRGERLTSLLAEALKREQARKQGLRRIAEALAIEPTAGEIEIVGAIGEMQRHHEATRAWLAIVEGDLRQVREVSTRREHERALDDQEVN